MTLSENWIQEIARAYNQIISDNPPSNDDKLISERIHLFDEFFGEASYQDPDRMFEAIDFNSLSESQQRQYEKLLQYNCTGVALSDEVYHITTWSRFCDAIRLGGFVLKRPGDWSISWEDTAFKNLLRIYSKIPNSSGPGVSDFVKCYQDSTYGMCWSLEPWNESVVTKDTRYNNHDPLVMLESTVGRLLAAYYQDRTSFARSFISKVEYEEKAVLKKLVPDIQDLQNANIGTACHLDSTINTTQVYADQKEVRLLFVDVPNDLNKKTITQRDVSVAKDTCMLVKPIDLKKVITRVDAVPFDLRAAIRNCGFNVGAIN